MEWGCRIADEKDLEGFVESAEDGVKLYESAGFEKVEKFYIEPTLPKRLTGDDAAQWNMQNKKSFPNPYPLWLMRRPKKSEL